MPNNQKNLGTCSYKSKSGYEHKSKQSTLYCLNLRIEATFRQASRYSSFVRVDKKKANEGDWMLRFYFSCLSLLFLSGCANFLSGHGPTIEKKASPGIRLIELSPENLFLIDKGSHASSNWKGMTNHVPTLPTLAIGDKVEVTVWEASDNGLFASSGQRYSEHVVQIDDTGNINFPFAGRIQAANLSLSALRDSLAKRLRGLTANPQVQVRLGNTENSVTVSGDVNTPGRQEVPASGIRLIDSLAKAGGWQSDGVDTTITLIRNDIRYQVNLHDVLDGRAENILLQANDTLIIQNVKSTYSVFGSVSKQERYFIEEKNFSLTDALASAGGLDEESADVSAVFLFRFETSQPLENIANTGSSQTFSQGIPTIYHLDLSQPQAFFLANSFEMKDNDIIYVASSSSREIKKFVDQVLAPILISNNAINALQNF